MKILITGGTGFIGSHLAEHLVKKNYKVTVFDRYNISNSYGWLEKSKYKSKIKFILGDIRDYDSTFKALKNIDVVLHLAALIGIPYSYISPTAYLKTNVEGTLNVLEASKNLRLKQVIITSTSEVYGTAKSENLSEQSPLSAQSPYAASKIAADQLALSYYNSFNLPVKIIRPFNTFGPRQSLRAIIPTILFQMMQSNNSVIKLGNTKITRDFTYVEDLCSAYSELIKSKKALGQVVNVGSNNEISIEKIISKASKILNKKFKIKKDKKRIRPKNSEVYRLKCNNSKLKKLTSWKVLNNFELGLKKTLVWIKKRKSLDNFKIKDYNI